MADAQAKKMHEEIERLEMDLKTLEGACTTSEAAKKCVCLRVCMRIVIHCVALTVLVAHASVCGDQGL